MLGYQMLSFYGFDRDIMEMLSVQALHKSAGSSDGNINVMTRL